MTLLGSYPSRRMRRLRFDSFSRELVRENTLTSKDLVYPIFVADSENLAGNITTMPGQSRVTVEGLLKTAEHCMNLKIPAIAIFPVVDPSKKTEDAREAYNETGLVPSCVSKLKKEFPDLGIITDVALDPYTSHGQDGLINTSGYVLNDETIAVLNRQALCHAAAGADIVAPSDMMDGRIGSIRSTLDNHGKISTRILAYAAKYSSSFYGPFRDAVGSAKTLGKADKHTYQMDPANAEEALHEVALDLEEGADLVMVKPGLPYLDIITNIRKTYHIPVLAYQVSGEYAMLKAASEKGWLDEKKVVFESLTCMKRAGTCAILTYFAVQVAEWLNSQS